MSAEALKELLSQPVSLFVLMLFGSLLSALKQMVDSRSNGSTITVAQYLFKVETLIMLGANVIAFITLIMTDTLNWTGAIGIGYVMNSLADLKPSTKVTPSRSADIVNKME
jgi:hypothetical protein